MVQCNVCEIADCSRERRAAQTSKSRNRMLRGTEAGVHQIEPNNVGPQLANGASESERVRPTVGFPAAHDMKAGQLLLCASEGVPILICGPLVARQLVAENSKVDERVALEFSRQMEAVFIQLAAAWGKRCH